MAARGDITGASRVGITAWNESVANGTVEDVWPLGGTYIWPTSAATISVVSDNDSDSFSAGGSGAQKVAIEGLDENWLTITETVNVSGTVANTTSQTFLRVNKAQVVQRGTYTGANLGTITLTHGGTSTAACVIPMAGDFGGNGVSAQSHYCVPKDKIAFLYYLTFNADAAKPADVAGNVRTNDTTQIPAAAGPPWLGIDNHQLLWHQLPQFAQFDIQNSPFLFPGGTDFWFQAEGEGAITEVAINLGLYVFDNPDF